MFQRALPAAVCAMLAMGASADELRVPGLSPDVAPKLDLPPCENTQDANSCARVLACVGRDGLWFDGQARGWNTGVIAGQMSDGVVCGGTWAYGGLLGSAQARLECENGLTARMYYYAQDSLTGTGRARGLDNRGRSVRAWTGNNVLQYLTPDGATNAKLPCTDAPIPIS